jgi:alpha-tubulin suppressor-like RCC1 family protein
MPAPTREEQLHALLLELFAADELRGFIQLGPEGGELAAWLPSPPASAAEIAVATVAKLGQRGMTREFLERLEREFPRRRGDIEPLIAQWADDPHLPAPAPVIAEKTLARLMSPGLARPALAGAAALGVILVAVLAAVRPSCGGDPVSPPAVPAAIVEPVPKDSPVERPTEARAAPSTVVAAADTPTPTPEPAPKLSPEQAAALRAHETADCRKPGGCTLTLGDLRVRAVVAGPGYETCIVLVDGGLLCWGAGALGYGEPTPRAWPWDADLREHPRIDAGGAVREVATGNTHTCAMLELHGRVRCWGDNSDGALGYGPIDPIGDQPGEMPPADVGVGAVAEHIAAGGRHTCVIVAGGRVRCWGLDDRGQLGDGDHKNIGDGVDEMPPADVPGITDAVEIVAGRDHTCVRLQGGAVRCWGDPSYGQLGASRAPCDDSIKAKLAGVTCPEGQGIVEAPLGGLAEQIVAGETHTCARLTGGAVRCWGDNTHGQLGGEDRKQRIGDEPGEMPPADVLIGGPAVQIAAGWNHTCALLGSKRVRCWGHWRQGQLGHGPAPVRPERMPPLDVELGGDVEQLLFHGGNFSCARLVDGTVRCWGSL